MAAEVGQTRLLMGANYRSDIDAGFTLGQAVAQKALARAATDGSDVEVDWHGAHRARDVGREGPAGAAAGDLEAVADDAGRPVPAGATAGHRLRGVPGGAGVAEAHQSEPDALPARHRHQLCRQEPRLRLGARLCAGAPRAAQRAAGGAAAGAACRRAIGRQHRRARYQISLLAAAAQHGGPHHHAVIPVPNHPAYVSNAAIIASAAAELVGAMFPQEAAYGSIWARKPASRASMAASTTPATSAPGTRWARASPRWRSSAISSTSRGRV